MQRAKRLETIITAARAVGGARVADLAAATGVTPMTIRRDLDDLEAKGVVRRRHGGVVAAPARGQHLPYAIRLESYTSEKAAIAEACASRVPEGASLILDDGSTCAAIARALAGRDLTVLALSIHVAAALGTRAGTRILTPGGILDPDQLSWTGSDAVDSIRGFRADLVILGICGWPPTDGPTAATLHDANIKRAAIASSVRTMVATTADKFDRSAAFAVCSPEAIDEVVTHGLEPATRDALEHRGPGTIHDAARSDIEPTRRHR